MIAAGNQADRRANQCARASVSRSADRRAGMPRQSRRPSNAPVPVLFGSPFGYWQPVNNTAEPPPQKSKCAFNFIFHFNRLVT